MYDLYLEQGFAPIRALWEAHSVTLNKETTLHTPQGPIQGVPRGLDEMGGLKVEIGGRKLPYHLFRGSRQNGYVGS